MLLSTKSVEGLAACTRPSRTTTSARREAARAAVTVAAEELGFEPMKPPLPRFNAGEDWLSAAVQRVLKVPGVEKTLEKHRARAAACEAAAGRIAKLRARALELQRVELGRLHDGIMAGKVPGPPPAEAVAERSRIAAELDLIGSADVSAFAPPDEGPLIMDAAMRPDVYPAVVLYGALVAERLKMLTADAPANSPALVTAKQTAGFVGVFAKRAQVAQDRELRELDRTVRTVLNAVTLADLHRLHEVPDPSLEELEAATAGR